MDFKIAVLAGDGIGPEISTVGVDVMTAVCEKFGHKVNYEYAICGADAIDKVGDPFPEATYEACKNADAVLFSAVGDPKFDNDPTAKVRPEQGLLAMRKKLGLFANIRPVQTFKCLLHKSPLTENTFGDILTDEGSCISGSMGLLPSASTGESTPVFEPIHGSWPQAKGLNIANPLAQILSVAMLFEYFDLKEEGALIRKAVDASLDANVRTPEIQVEGGDKYGTKEVGAWIVDYLKKS